MQCACVHGQGVYSAATNDICMTMYILYLYPKSLINHRLVSDSLFCTNPVFVHYSSSSADPLTQNVFLVQSLVHCTIQQYCLSYRW